MEWLYESWSLVVVLLASFVIGWGAETAQTFLSRALALSILAWLQTAPEFAVEAAIAWNQQRDLMIANLTGSLRLLVGLGWPLIFFVHYFFQKGRRGRNAVRSIRLGGDDSLGVLFLFVSIVYFLVILAKGSLTWGDSIVLVLIYTVYLVLSARLPAMAEEEEHDLPWIGKKIVKLRPVPKVLATVAIFVVGGAALLVSVEPFIHTLQKWSVTLGISTFVFVQWVAPFLSEFPEKVSAFNWARQEKKAPMAMMNMVSSNVNQWTMLAAMIPIVFNISLGRTEAITFDDLHFHELALTIAQSFLGGVLLLDMEFDLKDALAIFVLWIVQFLVASLREPIMYVYLVWIAFEVSRLAYLYFAKGHVPRAFTEVKKLRFGKAAAAKA